MSKFCASGGYANDPESFANAIVATSCPSNVVVFLGTIEGELPKTDLNIKEFKSYHQFLLFDDLMVARKVPGVGEGTLEPMEGLDMNIDTIYDAKVVNPKEQMEDYLPKRRTASRFAKNGTITVEPEVAYEEEKTEGLVMHQAGALWTCPKNPHCDLKYVRKSNQKKHQQTENSCRIRFPHPTRKDFLISLNVSDYGLPGDLSTKEGRNALAKLRKPPPIQTRNDLPLESTKWVDKDKPLLDQITLGYGLPLKKERTVIDPAVKGFVVFLFKQGVADITKKVKPAEAVRRIQDARNDDGTPMFTPLQWLKESQVRIRV